MTLFFDASQTLLSQYANSPVMGAVISSLNEAMDRQQLADDFYDLVWNVETARGYALDIWGRIVGVGRALYVPDGQYLGFAGVPEIFQFGGGVFYGGGSFAPNYLMTDAMYRRVILAKAALNITDGTTPALNAILMALFPNYGNVYAVDGNDMTMTIVFQFAPSIIDYAIASQSGVIPKPAGVGLTIIAPPLIELTMDSDEYSWDGESHSWGET